MPRTKPRTTPMTLCCMHCDEEFARHDARGDEHWCRDGQHRFDVAFQINPELGAFIAAHPDKSTQELTMLWIAHLRKRTP